MNMARWEYCQCVRFSLWYLADDGYHYCKCGHDGETEHLVRDDLEYGPCIGQVVTMGNGTTRPVPMHMAADAGVIH